MGIPKEEFNKIYSDITEIFDIEKWEIKSKKELEKMVEKDYGLFGYAYSSVFKGVKIAGIAMKENKGVMYVGMCPYCSFNDLDFIKFSGKFREEELKIRCNKCQNEFYEEELNFLVFWIKRKEKKDDR